MATNRSPLRRSRRVLSHDEELELWLGPGHRPSTFRDAEHARQAWMVNRDRIMAAWARNGRRPQGWWAFEASIEFPGHDRETSTLFQAGLLAEEEAAELVAGWRAQFQRAQQSDFFFCEGPGQFFCGAAARSRHYREIDIPASLVQQWSKEYRRRARTIRRLQELQTDEPHGAEAAG